MLIEALNDYYDILLQNGKTDPDGLSRQKVSHMIMLRPDGTIADIIDIRRASKPDKKGKTKQEPVEILLPERYMSRGYVNIIEHRPLYIFGLNYDKASGTFSPDDKTDKARKSHEAFIKQNLEYTEGMTSEIVTAYRNFMKSWVPEDEARNEKLLCIGKEYQSAYFCFALDGHPDVVLHDFNGEIIRKTIKEAGKTDKPDGICAVSGEPAAIARTHDKIKGILGVNATGGLLVCFNNPSEESYGKGQSYNSSISQNVMKRYTRSFNALAADPKHRVYIEGMTLLFWAMNKEDRETDLLLSMLGMNKEADADDVNKALFNSARELSAGRHTDLSSMNVDENVTFYTVGLSANVTRIVQKFVCRDKFGRIFENAARHQADMMFEETKTQISIWRLCSELKPPKSNDYTTSPSLISSIVTVVLSGARYPDSLLENAVRRVKIDKSVNYVRAGIIKACINRKARINNKKEEIEVALDKENSNQAYLCGRLFAVLERIQQNAAKSALNRTIKDAYFASACARPSVVFPKLMTLAQYHLKNDDYAAVDNRLMSGIIDKLGSEFPQTLSLDNQGRFILGYYQQYQSFFKKNENAEKEN